MTRRGSARCNFGRSVDGERAEAQSPGSSGQYLMPIDLRIKVRDWFQPVSAVAHGPLALMGSADRVLILQVLSIRRVDRFAITRSSSRKLPTVPQLGELGCRCGTSVGMW
jgi:hypothetical protein